MTPGEYDLTCCRCCDVSTMHSDTVSGVGRYGEKDIVMEMSGAM
jgi:hypothetical protein